MPAPVQPSVSVVVPTTGRRATLLPCVDSALAQPETAEVLVVYNGGRGEAALLDACRSRERVTVLEPDGVQGCGPARQVGVAQASSPWVAFLDDDDTWLPGKLERQLAAAVPGVRLVMSRSVWRLVTRDKVMPQRLPARGETLADYVFVVGSRGRHGLLWPPSLLVSAALLAEVPWWTPSLDPDLDRHEDMQWAARVSPHLGPGEWVVIPSVDAVGDRRSSDSMGQQARDALGTAAETERRWLELLGPLLSHRAERSFRLTHVWPYTRLAPGAVGDAAREPWAAAVGLHRRRGHRNAAAQQAREGQVAHSER